MKSYFTFGSAHEFSIRGYFISHNHVLEVEGEGPGDCRAQVFALVGPRFAFQYDNEPPDMSFFPGGIIRLSEILGD